MATTLRHRHRAHSQRVQQALAFGGYSLPEVMIASTVLAIVVASSVGTLTESGKSFNRSRERDAISTLIAKDLEEVRAAAFDYMRCEPTPQANEPEACTSARTNSFADGQITFVPDAIRCANNTLAEGLVASNPALVSSSTLSIPTSLSGISLGGVTISRSIRASGNELEVKYSSSSSSSGNQPVYQQALIVPESTGWCP
jgi:prepilin-type N-terminal cleavage/methylation domain-containing protein